MFHTTSVPRTREIFVLGNVKKEKKNLNKLQNFDYMITSVEDTFDVKSRTLSESNPYTRGRRVFLVYCNFSFKSFSLKDHSLSPISSS